jgi:hypothetical protein
VISLKNFLDHTGNQYQKWLKVPPVKTKRLRKISIKEDKEGKSRPFAIFEYISQMALTGLHDSVFEILKSIPQDATFDQNVGFRDILYSGHTYYASYDLTAATDRFPMTFQKRVVEHILGSKDLSDAWCDIMTGYPFELPDGSSIVFGAGQPLGAKSSWGVFTLSHHVALRIAALRSGVGLKDLPYKILGDDIVIMDKSLASAYVDVMTELGVQISKTKTHESNHFAEFAKRIMYRGSEITQFPITAMIECRGIYALVVQCLEIVVERGFIPLFIQRNSSGFWEQLMSIYFPGQNRLQVYMLKKYKTFNLLPTASKPFMVRVSDLTSLARESYGIDDLRIIDKCLLNAVIECREREIDRLVSAKQKYNFAVLNLLNSIMFFLPWDRISVTHREFLPVVSSLDASTALKVENLVSVRELQSGLTASETLETDPIKPVPSLRGLQPIRPNEVIARSRAALLKPLLNQFKLAKELGPDYLKK